MSTTKKMGHLARNSYSFTLSKNDYFPLDSCSTVSLNIKSRVEFPFSLQRCASPFRLHFFGWEICYHLNYPVTPIMPFLTGFFQDFFLCFWFFEVFMIMMHLHVDLRFILFGLFSASWISRCMSFTKFEKFSAILSSNNVSVPPSSFSFSVIPIIRMLAFLLLSHGSWASGFCFVLFFYFLFPCFWSGQKGSLFSLLCRLGNSWSLFKFIDFTFCHLQTSEPIYQVFIFLILKSSVLSFPFVTFYNFYFLTDKFLFIYFCQDNL